MLPQLRPEAGDPIRQVRSDQQAGFTLIEVMLALVLTAVAMMGTISLYAAEVRASGFSRHSAEAAVLAEDKVEKLRTLGPAVNIGVAAAGTCTSGTTEASIDGQGVAGGIFTRLYCETISANYADVVVIVSWNDDGLAHLVNVRARRSL